MKLVGLMLARNEAWVIGFSLRAALRWVDHMVVLDHASTDKTRDIVAEVARENPGRVTLLRETDPVWSEMAHRQRTLEEGRALGGTHFAIIDADEVLTSNCWEDVRKWAETLRPGQVLSLPMIPCWRSIDKYRDDTSVWSRSVLTLVFHDNKTLFWKSATDGYDHHNRVPYGALKEWFQPLPAKEKGGVMHLQFANWRRLRAKHYWYRMMETVRWPGRSTPEQLNRMYNQALDETGLKLSLCHPSWLIGMADLISEIKMDEVPWHEAEIKRLWLEHGPDLFRGLEIPNEYIGDNTRPFNGIPPEPVEAKPEPVEAKPEPVEAKPEPVEAKPEPVEAKPEPVEARSVHYLWFCSECGVLSDVESKNSDPVVVQQRLYRRHDEVSMPSCHTTSVRIITPEEVKKGIVLYRPEKAKPPLIVSYYTNETYRKAASELRASLGCLGLEFEIDHLPDLATWEEAVLYKASYMKAKLEKYPDRDLIWIDADAVVRLRPTIILEPDGFDIACHFSGPGFAGIFGGTVYYRNSPIVRKIVEEWVKECAAYPAFLDETNLGRVLERHPGVVVKNLPPEYCWVERWMKRRYPHIRNPVIEQYAISRPGIPLAKVVV